MSFFLQLKMTESHWKNIRKKGFLRYIVVYGYFKIGLLSSSVGCVFQYLYDFQFKELGSEISISNYLIWIPGFASFGFMISLILWVQYNIKYNITES